MLRVVAALRCIALGLLAGLCLSVLRAPAGLNLWHLQMPSASTRGLVRALARWLCRLLRLRTLLVVGLRRGE